MDAAAIGGEPIPGERRGGGARCAVINDIGPEPRHRCPALAGHEHRHRRVVGVELGGLQSFLTDTADDRIEQMRGLARPSGEGRAVDVDALRRHHLRSEEHTSELQSLMRNSYAVFCLKKKKHNISKILPSTTSLMIKYLLYSL